MASPPIEAFGGGGFRVAGLWRPGSLLLLAEAAEDWAPTSLAAVTPADLAAVTTPGRAAFDFLLLGAGPVQALPPRAVRDAVALAGLGLEFLATEAAVRLHNILAAEGRRFATALIAI